jgi:hypothetical protein
VLVGNGANTPWWNYFLTQFAFRRSDLCISNLLSLVVIREVLHCRVLSKVAGWWDDLVLVLGSLGTWSGWGVYCDGWGSWARRWCILHILLDILSLDKVVSVALSFLEIGLNGPTP